MTTGRGSARLLLAITATLALSPGAARAYSWSGRLGVGYDRVETWAGPAYNLAPKLRLDGALDASGFIVSPGVVDWRGRVSYTDETQTYTSGADSRMDILQYQLQLAVLQTPSARANVSGFVSRTRFDFSSKTSPSTTTGTTIADSYSVQASAAPPGAPRTEAAYTYTDSVNSGLDRSETRETWHTFAASATAGQPGLNTDARYESQWVEGTLAGVNFASQFVALNANVQASDTVTSGMSASYFTREPTQLGASNPRMENTLVNGYVDWGNRGSGAGGRFQYFYTHASTTDPTLQVREVLNHIASVSYVRPTSGQVRWTASAGASLSDARLGSARDLASGQDVGLEVGVTKPTTDASLGARIGAREPGSGSAELAYGVRARARKTLLAFGPPLSFDYLVGYDSNLGPTGGWVLIQTIQASLGPAPVGPMTLSARLNGSSSRGEGGAFGSSASRNYTAGGAIASRRASLDVELGMSDAVSGPLANPLADSLFIPAAFNTHVRYALSVLSVPLVEMLSFRVFAKYTVASGPAIPDQREAYVNPGLWYEVGFWSFSLEDRYTVGGATSFDRRVNEFYLRASRSFRGR